MFDRTSLIKLVLSAALVQAVVPAHAAKPESAAPSSTNQTLSKALQAEFAAKDKRPEEAANLYLEAAASEKRSDYAERAVRMALAARNFPLAENAANLWVKLAPTDINALQAQAYTLMAQSKKDDALSKLRALLLNPDKKAPELTIALLSAPDSRGMAVPLLEELRNEPALLALPVERGLVPLALRLKQNDMALEIARQYTERDAKNAKHWLWRGLSEVALEKGDAAAESYRKALALDPKNTRLRLSYAQVLNDLKRFDDIDAVLKAAPEPSEEIYQARIAFIFANTKNKTAKNNRLLKALAKEIKAEDKLEPNLQKMLLGHIYELSKQNRLAAEMYASVPDGEQWAAARIRLAVVQAETDLAKARTTLQKLQTREPENIDSYLLEADLLTKAQNLVEAYNRLSAGLKIAPENTVLLYARAMNSFAQGSIEGLEADLKLIISLDPQNAQALNALGYSLLEKTDRLNEATEYIQQAYYLEPNSSAIMDSLGWAYFKNGRLDQAIVQLRAAYEAEPEGEIASHVVEVLWALGAEPEAREFWTEALKKFPDSEPLKAVIKRFDKPTSGK